MADFFVDESKLRGYLLAAVVASPAEQPTLRRMLRDHVMSGQRRIHFTKERDERRRKILSAMREHGIRAHLIHTETGERAGGRQECLTKLVRIIADQAPARLILERDESLQAADRRHLFAEVGKSGARIEYSHQAPHEEPLLWAADAIAWSYARGGDWRRRIDPMLMPPGV